jgi:glutamate racemase
VSDSRPIGIFDSGVGGLTVVGEMKRLLPRERIVYFGDTARVPYGTKSKETVTKFSVENIEFLMKHDVKLVIVACNTASSLALEFLKRCFRVPIIGVIEPGARAAASVTRNKRIGVIGTQATIASGAYERAVRKMDPRIKLFARSCPLFVPLVEEGWIDKPVTREVASIYLSELKKNRIDTLIMGCTHYPILKGVIKKVIGPDVVLIDSALEVAGETRDILDAAGILNDSAKMGSDRFFASDEPASFVKIGARFLRRRIRCTRPPED